MAKEFRFGFIIEGNSEKGTKALRVTRVEGEKLAKQTDKVRTSTDRYRKAAEEQNKVLGRAKTMIAGLAGAAGFGALSIAVAKNTREFGAAVSNLSAITGAVGEDLEYLSDQARDIGKTTTLSAIQAVDAFKLVASAKPDLLQSGEALNMVTREAVALSEAAKIDLSQAADILGTSLNQYQAGADQASRYINVLAAGSQLGASAISDTSQALKNVGAAANAAGVDFETTNAAIQALAAGGLKASEAGTGLRNIILKLEASSEQNLRPSVVGLSGALTNLAERQLSVTELQKKFGMEGVIAAQTLVDQVSIVQKLETELRGTSIAYEQAATNTDNLDGDILKLQSSFESLTLTIGNAEEGAMRGFIKSTSHVIGLVDDLAEDSMPALNAILALTATTLVTRFAPAVYLALGPVGVLTGLLAGLALAYQNVRSRVDEARESLYDMNTQTISGAEATIIDLAKQINDLGMEYRELDSQLNAGTIGIGEYTIASVDLQREEQRLQELMDQTSERLKVLRESQASVKESTEQLDTATGGLSETVGTLTGSYAELVAKQKPLFTSLPLLRNEIQLVSEGVGVLSAATQASSVELVDWNSILTNLSYGVVPGFNGTIADTEFRMMGVTDAVAKSTDELGIHKNLVENTQREWANLIDTFIDGESDIGDFFDTFAKGIKRVVAEAAAADLANLIFGNGSGGNLTSLFSNAESLFSGGGGGSGGSGAGLNLGLGDLASGASAAWTALTAGGGSALPAAGAGAEAWAGFYGASGGTGGGLMSSLSGFMTSPAGIAIMVGLAGKVIHDMTNDPDGYHRGMAGFLAAPTPGAPAASQFDLQAAASGFDPTGFADGPASQAAARAIWEQFRAWDETVVALVNSAGGSVSLANATLGGFGVEGTGNGTFFGRTQKTTDAQFQTQIDSYVMQLAKHVEGLAPETMAQLMGASSAQQVVDILGGLTESVEEESEAARAQTEAINDQVESQGELTLSLDHLSAVMADAPNQTQVAIAQAMQNAEARAAASTSAVATRSRPATSVTDIGNAFTHKTIGDAQQSMYIDSQALARGLNLSRSEQDALGLTSGFFKAIEAMMSDGVETWEEITAIHAMNPAASRALGIQDAIVAMAGKRVDGSHAAGLDYVPFDGYVGRLHRGERVQSAGQARDADRTASEVRKLREETGYLRSIMETMLVSSNSTARTLDEAIRTGDGSLAVKVIS